MRIIVHKNERGAEGIILTVDLQTTSFDQLKQDISSKLKIRSVKRIFLTTGSEITNLNDLRELDLVYASCGEDYFKNPGSSDHFAISVVGAGGVGKSALTLRFVRNSFVNNWDPTIEDAYTKPIEVDRRVCKLDILDTAGQEDFESLRYQWMLDKDGYIFVFSFDNKESLKELSAFYQLHLQINPTKPVPIVICGNKNDLKSQNPNFPYDLVNSVVTEYHAEYLETSALTGSNVSLAFETLIRKIRSNNKPTPTDCCCCTIL